MAEMRRFALVDFLMLLLVLVVAGGTRAAYLITCAEGGNSVGPLIVQGPPLRPGDTPDRTTNNETMDLAASLQEGWFASKAPFSKDGEVEGTAHLAPGYPYLLGLLNIGLKKVKPPEGEEKGWPKFHEKLESAARWIQMGLGTLAAIFYFLFARRAFRSLAAGTLAGLFAGLNPFWIISTATLDDGTLAIFALGGCLFLASQAGEKGGAFLSLLLGLSLAGLALVRASFLPFSFATMIWFLVRSRSLDRGWLCALVGFLGFLIGLAPWTVRNFQRYNEPVPVVDSAYLELAIGNNEAADGGPATPKTWETIGPALKKRQEEAKASLKALFDEGKIDKEQYQQQQEAQERQTSRYALLGQVVVVECQHDPVKTMRRRLAAFLGFFLGWEGLTNGVFARETGEVSTEDSQAWDWFSERYPSVLMGWVLGMLGLTLNGWR
jgi:hypothetical protein